MLGAMISKRKKQIEAQRRLLEKAASRIESLEAQLRNEENRGEELTQGEAFMLSQLEGAFEVPVRWAEGPPGLNAVVTTERSPQAPGLPPLTVMALQSAFPNRARLDDLKDSGWALVQAWPLNAPGALESLPGYRTESYTLCALTSMGLRATPQHQLIQSDSSPKGFEARI